MKVLLLFAFVLLINCVRSEGLEEFLTAFPDVDYDGLNNLPKEMLDFDRIDEEIPSAYNFDMAACPTIAVPADTNNVNNLKPGNIRVVMAMGDSITAAMSAKDTTILSLKEYRGISYAIGADTGITTFPNILKPYVATGYPIGVSTGTGKREMTTNGLNGAVSGAVNKDLLGQAQWLVTQLKANTKININTDWKVLTLWMGSNNLCAVCNTPSSNDGANYETNVISALNYLYTNVPRLFVNLIGVLDISTLYDIKNGACASLHSIECSCVGTSDATKRAKVSTTAKDYVTRAYAIAKSYNARNKTDFAVVVQPFLTNNIITDRALVSAADCFHPSASGHVLASVALWNNMLTPSAQKKTSWSTSDTPICPTASSIFPTN